jgi:hypothetical protein
VLLLAAADLGSGARRRPLLFTKKVKAFYSLLPFLLAAIFRVLNSTDILLLFFRTPGGVYGQSFSETTVSRDVHPRNAV